MPQPRIRSALLLAGALLACTESQAPLAPAAGVAVGPAPGILFVGDTARLQARALDARGDTLRHRVIVWSSRDPDIASVSASGLVTAIGGGTTAIWAASEGVADSVAVTVIAPFLAVSVAAGESGTCAIDLAGASWCWGDSFNGGLGVGVSTVSVPWPVRQQSGPLAAIALGYQHGCSLASGAIACWGDNTFGDVGDSSTVTRVWPVPAAGGGGYSAVWAGGYSSCGLRGAQLYCWGNWIPSIAPVAFGPADVVSAGFGFNFFCVLRTGGAAACMGASADGGLGDGSSQFSDTLVTVTGGHQFTRIAVGTSHACGLDASGAAWCWGSNTYGQLGDGTATGRLAPVAVAGGLSFQALSSGSQHVCGVTGSGAAWCWGYNGSGNLGDSTLSDRRSPVPVAGGLTFTRVSAGGAHSCGIATGGRVYCWGDNGLGRLGLGDTASVVPLPSPVPQP